ncbi:MAG: sigma-54-dependent transcriptional regulator [Planctomycetota bacterium]
MSGAEREARRGRVLVVDDDASLRESLTLGLEAEGFTAEGVGGAEQAWERLRTAPYEAVLTDLRMRGPDGLELCARARDMRPDVPVVVMTAFGDLDAAVGALRAGAYDFIAKPFETRTLALALDRAVQHCRLREELGLLQERLRAAEPFEELLGESAEMRELADQVQRVARTDATVLITGETGVGKELVARALHRRSARAGGPFVALNCAAVPEALLESELFGHARGAFTGALGARRGLFQNARGGTLFLDEVGDMPPLLQAKLLRALQERTVRPVGSDEEVEVDARIVAATHQDLEAAVAERTFRQDLLYRINVIHLRVPPLRERGDDMLLLAQHFLRQLAARDGRGVTGLSPQVADLLLAHDWPGNVRELQNCIERAVALTQHERLVPDDLPPRLRQPRARAWSEPHEVELLPLEAVERRHILGVLGALGGNKARASSVLGIGRKTLYRKLAQYGSPAAEGAREAGGT